MINRNFQLPILIGESDPDTAVLFIHGLGGSYKTWGKFTNHLKLNWLNSTSYSIKYDEYYPNEMWYDKIPIISSLINILSGPSIEELSEHLKTVVDEVCYDYEQVILVAHSMGGLVSRKFIVERLKLKKDLGKVKALITYATPHHGSVHANVFKVSLYFFFRYLTFQKSEQVIDLSKKSVFLKSLNKEWSDLRVEDKIKFIRVVGLNDWIVNKKSSSYIDDENVRKVANKGHFSIIVPNKRNSDPAFLVTFNFLKKFNEYLEEMESLDDLSTEFL
jgi:pimeloyl-ACP methyl ester carboxylesterase